MLQIFEKNFENLEDAQKYANKISLDYPYLIDISIYYTIETKWTVILKFNITTNKNYNILNTFNLAYLEDDRTKDNQEFKTEYKIKFFDTKLNEKYHRLISRLTANTCDIFFELEIISDDIDRVTAIRIRKTKNESEYNITTNKCEDNPDKMLFSSLYQSDKHFFAPELDSSFLLNHTLEVFKQRGYLLNNASLKILTKIINDIVKVFSRSSFE